MRKLESIHTTTSNSGERFGFGALAATLLAIPLTSSSDCHAQGLSAFPNKMEYQARIFTPAGVPFATPAGLATPVTLRIYPTPTGGTVLHTTILSEKIEDGYLLVMADENGDQGSSSTLSEAFNEHADLYLEVEVDGLKLEPRMKLNAVPYAFRARFADTAATAEDVPQKAINPASIIIGGTTVIDNSRNVLGNSFWINGTQVIDSSRNVSANGVAVSSDLNANSGTGALRVLRPSAAGFELSLGMDAGGFGYIQSWKPGPVPTHLALSRQGGMVVVGDGPFDNSHGEAMIVYGGTSGAYGGGILRIARNNAPQDSLYLGVDSASRGFIQSRVQGGVVTDLLLQPGQGKVVTQHLRGDIVDSGTLHVHDEGGTNSKILFKNAAGPLLVTDSNADAKIVLEGADVLAVRGAQLQVDLNVAAPQMEIRNVGPVDLPLLDFANESPPGEDFDIRLARTGENELTIAGGDVRIIDGCIFALGGFCPSDERLKTDVRTIARATDLLKQLRGVDFRWKEPPAQGPAENRQVGLLAQDVQRTIPSAVRPFAGDLLSVDYDQVIPVLVEAVKEIDAKHQSELKEKDVKIQSLEARLAELEARLTNLEKR